jgi:hypothetical protein
MDLLSSIFTSSAYSASFQPGNFPIYEVLDIGSLYPTTAGRISNLYQREVIRLPNKRIGKGILALPAHIIVAFDRKKASSELHPDYRHLMVPFL